MECGSKEEGKKSKKQTRARPSSYVLYFTWCHHHSPVTPARVLGCISDCLLFTFSILLNHMPILNTVRVFVTCPLFSLEIPFCFNLSPGLKSFQLISLPLQSSPSQVLGPHRYKNNIKISNLISSCSPFKLFSDLYPTHYKSKPTRPAFLSPCLCVASE